LDFDFSFLRVLFTSTIIAAAATTNAAREDHLVPTKTFDRTTINSLLKPLIFGSIYIFILAWFGHPLLFELLLFETT
jgi:hypothetical protein